AGGDFTSQTCVVRGASSTSFDGREKYACESIMCGGELGRLPWRVGHGGVGPARAMGSAWLPDSVGFRIDRDVVRVGRAEGRFTAIRLRAQGNLVHMLDLKVVYANGDPDDIPVRADIRPGGQTGALDLRGRDRSIREVQMIY